ncbi:hypothetical protein BCF44_10591 [Kutzneria buriramensis]|uniref:DUF222 domain-containing protein n=1 Tax=Kutzneria buriramensis TaxID=1045776 RepID=A0A3E0HP00_9PSEU|nr:hypothetical protein BCF44_10591 [Kutzneria buriramensis]
MTATWDANAVWRMDEPSLWHACAEAQTVRQSAYVRIVEMVAELWDRMGRSKEDRVSLVAQVQNQLRVTKRDALQIVGHAELFASEAIRDAARVGELDADRLTVPGETLAGVPILDRDRVEAEPLHNTHFHLNNFRTLAGGSSSCSTRTAPNPRTTSPSRSGSSTTAIALTGRSAFGAALIRKPARCSPA